MYVDNGKDNEKETGNYKLGFRVLGFRNSTSMMENQMEQFVEHETDKLGPFKRVYHDYIETLLQ